MSFIPESFAPAGEIDPLPDMRAALRGFAKSARAKRAAPADYPRRDELLKILGEARGSIDRINAR